MTPEETLHMSCQMMVMMLSTVVCILQGRLVTLLRLYRISYSHFIWRNNRLNSVFVLG